MTLRVVDKVVVIGTELGSIDGTTLLELIVGFCMVFVISVDVSVDFVKPSCSRSVL